MADWPPRQSSEASADPPATPAQLRPTPLPHAQFHSLSRPDATSEPPSQHLPDPPRRYSVAPPIQWPPPPHYATHYVPLPIHYAHGHPPPPQPGAWPADPQAPSISDPGMHPPPHHLYHYPLTSYATAPPEESPGMRDGWAPPPLFVQHHHPCPVTTHPSHPAGHPHASHSVHPPHILVSGQPTPAMHPSRHLHNATPHPVSVKEAPSTQCVARDENNSPSSAQMPMSKPTSTAALASTARGTAEESCACVANEGNGGREQLSNRAHLVQANNHSAPVASVTPVTSVRVPAGAGTSPPRSLLQRDPPQYALPPPTLRQPLQHPPYSTEMLHQFRQPQYCYHPHTPLSDQRRLAFVNGAFVEASVAGVPLSSYGCAIVEEMLVSDGTIIRLDEHIDRLVSAAAGLSLPLPLDQRDLRQVCLHVVESNRDGHRAALYILLSFGVYVARSRRLSPLNAVAPSLVVHSHPLAPVPYTHLTCGIALYPAPDNRPTFSHPDEPSAPYVSSLQLPEVLALHTAVLNGFDEAALFDMATSPATFTSTTVGNLFVVKFGICYTPPATGKVPDGVMRRFVLDACRKQGIEVREVSIPMAFLTTAAEVFCTVRR
jgi:branched-subunit amino acid aminotransferase/4-amino-4-deoxychorismate lyase